MTTDKTGDGGKGRNLNLAISILAICAVVMTASNLWGTFIGGSPARGTPLQIIPEWQQYVGGQEIGGGSAAIVTLTVFSDYECPVCRFLNQRIRQMREQYPAELSVLFRHAPAGSRLHATSAAKTAICGSQQVQFSRIHDLLFDSLAVSQKPVMEQIASSAGVNDSAKFAKCVTSQFVDSVLAVDRQLAGRLGVIGTPTILFDSAMFLGVPPDLEIQIGQRIRAARPR